MCSIVFTRLFSYTMNMVQSIPIHVQKVINQIITNYKPQKVILFGSQAEGQATVDSDYDLFMVKNTSGTIAERQYTVWKSINNWSVPFDFVVYTPKEIIEAKRHLSTAHLNHDNKGFDDTTCYFTHQTAELALKAFLIAKNTDFPKVHTLPQLLSLCMTIDPDFSHNMDDMAF